MRLEASEDDMYKRMDQRDRMMILIPVCGVVISLGMFLFAAGYLPLIGIGITGFGVVAAGISMICYLKLKGLVMPMRGCFMEIGTDSFAAVQPYKDGKYESCRIYFKDVENLVKEKKGGGFYLMTAAAGRSSIQIGNENNLRQIFLKSFGYEKKKIETIYRIIRERLPESAKVYEYEE